MSTVLVATILGALALTGTAVTLVAIMMAVGKRDTARQIRKLPKVDRRVFCKDCKHYRTKLDVKTVHRQVQKTEVHMCLVSTESVDPIVGVSRLPSIPQEKNRNFDCPDHTPHGAERIRPGSSKDSP